MKKAGDVGTRGEGNDASFKFHLTVLRSKSCTLSRPREYGVEPLFSMRAQHHEVEDRDGLRENDKHDGEHAEARVRAARTIDRDVAPKVDEGRMDGAA